MHRAFRYFLFGLAFVIVGLLVGFKIKDNSSVSRSAALDANLKKFQQALEFIEENYVMEPDHDKLVDDAIKGIMEGLDPHSTYFSAPEMNQMQERMEGSFDGIGIQFEIIEDTIYVVTPLAGGPSEKLGIQSGDRIIEVDGESVAGVGISNTDVYTYLKGPRGSEVQVKIYRNTLKEYLDFDIVRDKIPIHSVNYSYMIDEEVGFIQVSRFAETTYAEFKEHLQKLQSQGMKKLVLDLRSNPGGYMTMANKMADEFLPAGKLIVSTQGRISHFGQQHEATASIGSFEEGALVILIDYSSASASEIVAGAVQDHDRGIIAGVRSFGKGMVQIQEDFEDGSAIRLVISKYYTPSGRSIQKPYNKTSAEYDQEILERFESGEIFDESKMQLSDSLTYETASGRKVYGGGGIAPDVFIPEDTTKGSAYLSQLNSKNVFRTFAFHYVDGNKNLIERYPDSKTFRKEFKLTDEIMSSFIAEGKQLDVAFNQNGYNKSSELIRTYVKAFIGRRMFGDDGFYPVYFESDEVLQEALKLFPMAEELENTGRFTER
ncbi:MAG: S41 family peptidase [Bacteroidota bacterium]